MTRCLPSTLTWCADAQHARTVSSAGHVITGTRGAAGKVWYNAWIGEPNKSPHLEAGYGPDGLARCKSACERHAESSSSEVAGQ